MNKDTRDTIDFCEIGLRETYCTYDRCIFMGKVRVKLDSGAILWTIFIWCGPYSQELKYSVSCIAIFSRSQHQFCHECTLILQQYCWADLTRWWFYDWRQRLLELKKKWSLEKEKIKQNLNAIAEDFSLKKIVYIQGSPALCQPFFPFKPHTQTFLTFQSKWAPQEELCLNNNSAFRGRYLTKFWIIWINLS